MAKCVLDTSVLSDVLRRREPVYGVAQEYLAVHGTFTFSILTWYEVERGLRKKDARAQRLVLDMLVRESEVLPLGRLELGRAADIWAQLQRLGSPVGEVDIMIAATARVRGLSIATKDKDYNLVNDLVVERWGDL